MLQVYAVIAKQACSSRVTSKQGRRRGDRHYVIRIGVMYWLSDYITVSPTTALPHISHYFVSLRHRQQYRALLDDHPSRRYPGS
jgi:hypothetical protein